MKPFLFFLLCPLLATQNFYAFSLPAANGTTLNFAAFQGKKVLIVNTAIDCKDSAQLQQLEDLYQLYHNTLVIVAVPSNSFQHEPRNNGGITQYLSSHYTFHYHVAAKMAVTTAGQGNLYQWLSRKQNNGYMDNDVVGDYQKFLVDEEGNLVGTYAPSVQPLSQMLKNAIEKNWENN